MTLYMCSACNAVHDSTGPACTSMAVRTIGIGSMHPDLIALLRERDELLLARAALERIGLLADEVEHDIKVVEMYHAAHRSGGQHVGTGGALGAASPSTLSYLQRLVRDLRNSARAKEKT